MRRCHVTKNQCGTDTWGNGYTCPCDECVAYLAESGIRPYGPYVTCQHGHSVFHSFPCPRCPSVPLSIAPVRCDDCHDCLHDPSLGFANPTLSRMILCPECGNKRCPKATNHRNACTDSNEPGQPGSNYPKVP